VVGFSRLTGSDEEGTLVRLRTLWSDLIVPTIAVHRGRVVKRTGDGSIISVAYDSWRLRRSSMIRLASATILHDLIALRVCGQSCPHASEAPSFVTREFLVAILGPRPLSAISGSNLCRTPYSYLRAGAARRGGAMEITVHKHLIEQCLTMACAWPTTTRRFGSPWRDPGCGWLTRWSAPKWRKL
jgi:hypothetical protein